MTDFDVADLDELQRALSEFPPDTFLKIGPRPSGSNQPGFAATVSTILETELSDKLREALGVGGNPDQLTRKLIESHSEGAGLRSMIRCLLNTHAAHLVRRSGPQLEDGADDRRQWWTECTGCRDCRRGEALLAAKPEDWGRR